MRRLRPFNSDCTLCCSVGRIDLFVVPLGARLLHMLRDLVVFAAGAGAAFAVQYLFKKKRPVWLHVEFEVKDAKAWGDAMLPLIDGSQAEPGNRRYVLHRPCQEGSLAAGNASKFTLIEEFDNQSALDAHNTYDHFLTYAPILGANAAVTITKLTPI